MGHSRVLSAMARQTQQHGRARGKGSSVCGHQYSLPRPGSLLARAWKTVSGGWLLVSERGEEEGCSSPEPKLDSDLTFLQK